MNKKIAIFLIGILSTTFISGCSFIDNFGKSQKIARFVTDEKIARASIIQPTAEIEILDLSKENLSIILTKSAIATAKDSAYVMPQTNGKVSSMRVSNGSSVNKGTILMTLGDSLSTDISQIQYETALKTLDLSRTSQFITGDSSVRTIEISALGVKTAYESYQNAINSRYNAENIYDEQYSGAKITRNSTKNTKNTLEDTLSKLEKTISSLETQKATILETLDQLTQNDPPYSDLSAAMKEINSLLAEAKTQKSTLESNIKSIKDGLKQADNGLDILEVSFEAQKTQLEFAIFAAEKQYEIAIKQFEISTNAAELQNIGLQTQILQLDSAAKMAELSNNQKNITSPIKGIITELSATKNNFVSLGQPVAKVEDPETLLIKTAVNSKEIEFLTLNQSVDITYGSKKISGKITSINPSINDYTKKINIEITANNTGNIPLGSLVKIEIPITTNQIFIPLNSLYNNNEGQFVKIINDDKVEFVKVEIGEIIGTYIEITSGLKGSEQLVSSPNSTLEENEIVTIKK
ncbi:MAG: efflux RND transporter periplasmic adaptor subunit [Candidatus Gracilibacteria bacterium]|nr:efflux RND transporter periplasmic adaptor subunit [Candidatus Gracilibacteria bacterium]